MVALTWYFQSTGETVANEGPWELRWSLRLFQWVSGIIKISLNIYWVFLKPPSVDFLWSNIDPVYSDGIWFCCREARQYQWEKDFSCWGCRIAWRHRVFLWSNYEGHQSYTFSKSTLGARTINKEFILIRGSIHDTVIFLSTVPDRNRFQWALFDWRFRYLKLILTGVFNVESFRNICLSQSTMWLKRKSEAPETEREQRTCLLFFSHQITEKQISKAGRRPHLCSFQRQTLIETWGGDDHAFSGWWTERVCSHSLHWWIQSASSPPFFFPGRLIKPTLEADFFSHCQQMPACICISTLPLKRHPGFFTATLH